jgi:AcrR family transcriptional regulator
VDNTSGQTSTTSAASPRKPRRSDGAATRTSILQSARRRLIEGGYANLNVRDIARDAGVNHGLIGYHFRGKQQLVLAVLDEANKALLDRQSRMYEGTSKASKQWKQACDFYDADLDSGFVHLLVELMAASFHDEALRSEFLPKLLTWHRLIEAAVTNFIEKSNLDLPVSAQAITAWIGWFWTGMEISMVLRIPEKDGHQREALEAVGTLLRQVERAVKSPPRRRTT